MKIWACTVCGVIYPGASGMPQGRLAAGSRWGDIPDDRECPECGGAKSDFEVVIS